MKEEVLMAISIKKRVFNQILNEINLNPTVPLQYVSSIYLSLLNGETLALNEYNIKDLISSGAVNIFDVEHINLIKDQIVGISVKYALSTLENEVKQSVENTFKKDYGK
jgi:hypothetical protein